MTSKPITSGVSAPLTQSLLASESGDVARIITASSAPLMAALDDTQTPADGFTAGVYASSEGTVTGQVVTYLVNGIERAGDYDLSAGDQVQAREAVTDSAGNPQNFYSLSVTVTPSVALANTTAPSIIGTPEVWQTVSLAGDAWAGSAARSYEFTWSNGATGQDYTIQPGDDLTQLGGSVTADDGFTRVTANAAPVSVTYAAPSAAGALLDRTYDQNTGVQTVDVSGDFTGAVGGTFSVSGAGASISQAGLVSIPTNTLRTSEVISVSYTNSGGTATSAFSVTVEEVEALTNTAAPTRSGTPEVGQIQTASTGTWTSPNSISFTYQWLRNSTAISGATGSTYLLAAADDLTEISCRVTADDGVTQLSLTTAPVSVTYAAPSAAGALLDLTYDQNTGVQTVDVSGDFSDAVGGTFSISGAGASISQAGLVSIPTNTVRAAATVSVSYTNSGGTATSAFSVTVEAAAPAGDNVLLFVTGQSNARVAGNSSATPPTKYTDGSLGDVQILVRDATGSVMEQIAAAAFEPYDVATNADPDNTLTAWGSEAEFIYQMRQNGDTRTVYIVKECVNGQNLYEQWNPATSNDKFDYLEAKAARARALITDGFGDEYLIWNQGEADANVGAGPGGSAADDYHANFTAWFSALRSRVTSSAFVIVQRIRPLGYDAGDGVTNEAGWPRAWTIREAQIAVPIADGNGTTIDTDFIPGNFGLIHPPEPWTEGMGLRSYAAAAGTYDATYGAITDTTPDAFSFTDQTDVAPSGVIVSNPLLVAGIERRAAVTVTGGEFRTLNSLNGDSVVSDWATSGFVDKYQKIQIRQTASGSLAAATSATVTVGGVSDTWTVTTYASAPSFEPETQAFMDQVAANGGGTIAGADATALNDFYVAAKATSWWSKILKLYPRLGDEVASRLDLKGQTLSILDDFADPGDEWVWSAADGWTGGGGTGAGASGGLDLRVNPSADLPQNGSTVMVFYSALAVGSQTELNAANSVTESSGSELFMRALTNGAARYRLNSGSNTSVGSGSLPTDPGMRAIVRSSASAIALHGSNGAVIHSASTASIATSENKLHIGNRYGTYSDARVLGAGAANEALSEAELGSLASTFQTLLDHFAP